MIRCPIRCQAPNESVPGTESGWCLAPNRAVPGTEPCTKEEKEVPINMKTNAMRLLDQAGIPYTAIEYEVNEESLNGEHVAKLTGIPKEQVFKTLVTRGEKNGIYVFCIPVALELNLKKAALVTGEKKIEMIHVKDILTTTGYVRGGCSPIGMRKRYPTYIDETAIFYDDITVSAGVRGCQLTVSRERLVDYIEARLCDIAD